MAKHHGWQWLLGKTNTRKETLATEKRDLEIHVQFDDILVEKCVSQNEVR